MVFAAKRIDVDALASKGSGFGRRTNKTDPPRSTYFSKVSSIKSASANGSASGRRHYGAPASLADFASSERVSQLLSAPREQRPATAPTAGTSSIIHVDPVALPPAGAPHYLFNKSSQPTSGPTTIVVADDTKIAQKRTFYEQAVARAEPGKPTQRRHVETRPALAMSVVFRRKPSMGRLDGFVRARGGLTPRLAAAASALDPKNPASKEWARTTHAQKRHATTTTPAVIPPWEK